VDDVDMSADPNRVDGAPLPVLSTTAPSLFPNRSARSDADRRGCRITIDDVVKDEHTTHGARALTFCVVTSA
jgi:hypothetical protein